MFYVPYGPFSLPKTDNRSGSWRADFWNEVERKKEGLGKGQGIYIFVIRWGDKFIPYYVGMTCSSKGFSGEVFQEHKLRKYREAERSRNGKPEMFLIAKSSEEDRDRLLRSSSRSRKQIAILETYLIGMCLTSNRKLKNDRKTAFHKNLDIEGVIGPRYFGARRSSARDLRSALGLAA